MTDDEEAVRKGRKAQQTLEDETLVAALSKLENDQVWLFKSTRAEETAKREQCWSMLKAIESLRTELVKVIDNGKVAQRAIERVQKK
jgi:signal transduction protein with GAF and PtsI domain